jgi:hypothetical protein
MTGQCQCTVTGILTWIGKCAALSIRSRYPRRRSLPSPERRHHKLVQFDRACFGLNCNDGVVDGYQIFFLQFEQTLTDFFGFLLGRIHDDD